MANHKLKSWHKYILLGIISIILYPLIPFVLLWLMWSKTKWTNKVKWSATIVAVLLFIGMVGMSEATSTQVSNSEIALTDQKSNNTKTEVKEVKTVITSEKLEEDKKPSIELFTVTRIVDGDTIVIDNGEKVRYIGIDTPESKDPRKPVECFSKEATNKNTELVSGKKIRLEKDITDRDKYNRILRYVYLEDGMFVNLQLVKQGYARNYTYPPEIKHQEEFRRAEEEARNNKLGLWADNACVQEVNQPQQTTQTQEPTIQQPKTNQEQTPPQTSPNQCLIKGNISSSGEKIYHVQGGQYYDATIIDESKSEKWFCSESEAKNAGWRRSKK